MRLPTLMPISELALRPREVFVSAGGFEERVLAFPQTLEACGAPQSLAVLLEYLPHHDSNRLEQVRMALSARGCHVTQVQYDRHAPGEFDSRLVRILRGAAANALCLDLSGMSRLAIMIIADVARELNLPLRIVYAEASRYAPTQEEFEAAKTAGHQHLPTSFIHTGVYDVVHVPRLASIRMQNHAALLLAFDSFNEALCQALVNVINPSRFILINGRPPRKELAWREAATAYVHQWLRREWSVGDDNIPIKVTSTLRYEETYSLLAQLYWQLSDSHRVVLAPTGSKMQTLGAYFLRAVHDDVHVEYPTVEGFFAEKYSSGVRQKWQVDFGRMGDLIARLRAQDIHEHLGLPQSPVSTDIE